MLITEGVQHSQSSNLEHLHQMDSHHIRAQVRPLRVVGVKWRDHLNVRHSKLRGLQRLVRRWSRVPRRAKGVPQDASPLPESCPTSQTAEELPVLPKFLPLLAAQLGEKGFSLSG